jgi:GNAT superfamily N-acetyltransferase
MRPLTLANFDRVVEVMSSAFADDPLWVYLFPDSARRRNAIPRFYRVGFALPVRNGQAYGAGDEIEGVAVWSVPLQKGGSPLSVLNADLFRLLFSPSIMSIRKAFPIFSQFDRMHKQYVREPHYYLNSIGVLPEAQGKGLASKLIRPFLARADTEGVPAYTETMTPSNVPLYQHFGFQIMEQYRVPKTDLSIWSLLRPCS